MPQYVIIEKVRLLQRGTPTPEHPIQVERYIKIPNMGWYKAVTDTRELELLGDEK
jgi:hypothetical protein